MLCPLRMRWPPAPQWAMSETKPRLVVSTFFRFSHTTEVQSYFKTIPDWKVICNTPRHLTGKPQPKD